MSIESPFDPRAALVRTKYFNQYPQPLERWLWKQGLPQAAERVFWLHWMEGKRNGDWSSEIPVRRVALECCVDPSTVTRSYQLLKSLGLIRREDPGRDPSNPFCQATAITEVRLPREFLTQLSRSPNRPVKDSVPGEMPTVAAPAVTDSIDAATHPDLSPEIPAIVPRPRPSRRETQALWERASEGERARFFTASRDRLTTLEFDAGTRLSPEDRGQILAQLTQLVAAKPTSSARTVSAAKPPNAGPRRLNLLDLARARKRIVNAVPSGAAPEILRQVLWAVEQGALRRFEVALALNIALKKIREGAWTKPNRMPPNWALPARAGERALPEQCSAA
jgi:hypothetical protein